MNTSSNVGLLSEIDSIAVPAFSATSKIFEVASKVGATIESISLKRPALDDVFMAYTGRELREEAHMTIFLTTHYMDEADKLCDRISIIDYGQIKVVGKPNELKSQIGGDIITLRLSLIHI